MSIVSDAKEIADLVKKMGDVDLYRRIVELQGEVTELASRNVEIESELRAVKGKLELRASLAFRQPYYWREGDDVPYCQVCFEKSGIAFHLDAIYTDTDSASRSRFCRSCHSTFYESSERQSAIQGFGRPITAGLMNKQF